MSTTSANPSPSTTSTRCSRGSQGDLRAPRRRREGPSGRARPRATHLAAKYFPARVDQKCKDDPSLGVAHGCFWKYHPERAYAWELRLQDEIEPGFTIDEDGSDEARAAFEKEHPDKVQELREKEDKRRERKRAKAEKSGDGELFEDS